MFLSIHNAIISVNSNSGVQFPARIGGAGPAHNEALKGSGLPVYGPAGEGIQTELEENYQ